MGLGTAYFILKTLITILAIIGNSLIIIVMRGFDRMSTSIYLSVLAVCDTLIMLAGPLVTDFLANKVILGKFITDLHILPCVLCNFILYWAAHVSSWCLVIITVERLVVILKPHK